jgi:hypothetical protein
MLQPRCSPGHRSRKARAFAADIQSLRGQGYTLQAIREALADAGVAVSLSTVSREVKRGSSQRTPNLAEQPATLGSTGAPMASIELASQRHGKDIAEAFMHEHISNPLFRRKETR